MLNSIEYLNNQVYKGAEHKGVVLNKVVSDRINRELLVIEKNGFAEHFILYSRIAEVCNELNLIRSPGRSDSINSMVNYCLDITKVDPINENLWFESFLHHGQKYFPDIDIDVPYGSREIVIETIKNKHPEYNVYPIKLKRDDNKLAIHACGVIITEFKPEGFLYSYSGQEIYQSPDIENDPIYNNNKADILELIYLKRLQLIVNEIGEEYHPYRLPLNDKQVFDFFASRDLKNILNFESPKLSPLLAEVRPKSIYELSLTYFRFMNLLATSKSFSHTLSYTILSYWGCYYKKHFPRQFEIAFSKELD